MDDNDVRTAPVEALQQPGVRHAYSTERIAAAVLNNDGRNMQYGEVVPLFHEAGINRCTSGGGTFGGEHASRTMSRHTLMTKHRLIRCAPSALLATAYIGHPLVEDRASDTLHHWRRPAESELGNAVHWYDHVPVIGDVGCCLSVDRGATGAVAHLVATAPLRRGVLPRPLVRLALSSWSHRKLVGLAKVAEMQAIGGADAV